MAKANTVGKINKKMHQANNMVENKVQMDIAINRKIP